jgi:3-hydroxyisobutyrate dehydrogenase
MGERMAHRLIDAGFQLTVYERTAQRTDALVAAGARAPQNLTTIAANWDMIMSCVTSDQAVLDIYARAKGVLCSLRPGTIVIEMSTVLPETSQKLGSLRVSAEFRFWRVQYPAVRRQRNSGR